MYRPSHKPRCKFLGLETERDFLFCKYMIDKVSDHSPFPGQNKSTHTGNPLNAEDLQGC